MNTYTTSGQSLPAVACDSAGNFVVVWQSVGSAGSDTSSHSIHGQRYDSAGVPQGGEFQVNTYTTSSQRYPAVASDSAGNFVVVWASSGSAGSDTSGVSIQGQRYDSAGVPQGGEFQVNAYIIGTQTIPAVAADSAGNFVVVWFSAGSDGSDTSGPSVQGQRYDSTGVPQGGEFQVNTYTTMSQTAPAVAADSAGNFVVVWQSVAGAGSDTSGYRVHGQRYDGAGALQGVEFQVNTYTTSNQWFPAVAAGSAGSFVVAWESYGSSGSDPGVSSIQGQRYAVPTTTSTSMSSTTSTTLLNTDLLPGRITVIKPGVLAKFVAKPMTGDTFTHPIANPIAVGGALRIFDLATTAGDDTYNLPAGVGWRGLGTPVGSKGYKYKGAGTMGDPCKLVLVKETVIKGVCKGTGISLTPPFDGDVGIILSLGTTDRYCAQFGGDEVKNDATLTKWKNAPVPGTCP